MDLKQAEKESKPNGKCDIDVSCVKRMFYLRFKLMNFMNNVHDLICNQVYKNLKFRYILLKIKH